MKKTKRLMFLAMLCMAAFTLTSCLNSDDDQDEITSSLMTEAEANQYLTPISGYHMGTLRAYFTNKEGKQDSVFVAAPCVVSAEAKNITFEEFPVSILKNYLNTDADAELRAALEEKEGIPMITNMKAFWTITNNTTGQSSKFFYQIPNNKKLEFTLNYGGQEHKAVVNFIESVNINYYTFDSRGLYDPTTYKMQLQFIISSFTVDSAPKVQLAALYYTDN